MSDIEKLWAIKADIRNPLRYLLGSVNLEENVVITTDKILKIRYSRIRQ